MSNTESHPVSTTAVVHVGSIISQALSSLHTRGLCHGDLKASNILFHVQKTARYGNDECDKCSSIFDSSAHLDSIFDSNDPFSNGDVRIFLADFGLSELDPSLTQASTGTESPQLASLDSSIVDQFFLSGRSIAPCGAMSCRSPESHRSQRSGGIAADIWAFGVLLWTLLEGSPPISIYFNERGLPTSTEAAEFAHQSTAPFVALQVSDDYWAVAEALDGLPAIANSRREISESAWQQVRDRGSSDVNNSFLSYQVRCIICSCLQSDPKLRPSSVDLSSTILQLLS